MPTILNKFLMRILSPSSPGAFKREIIINAEPLETRVAVLENGQLEDFQVEHPTEERLVGSIFKGRIQNLENDLQAAFVDIGLKKNAFLHYWDMNPEDDSLLEDDSDSSSRQRKPRSKRYNNDELVKSHPPGSVITVQVSKGAIGTKGPRVTASLSIPGRYLVLMPNCTLRGVSKKISDGAERTRLKKILDRIQPLIPKDCGLIVRTAGQGASKRSFIRDLRVLLSSYAELQSGIADRATPCCVYEEPDLIMRVVRDWMTEDIDRIIVDNPEVYDRIRHEASRISRRARNIVQLYEGHTPILDQYGVQRQVEDTFRRKVNMKSGAYLVIDETEALIAVDVNTGRHKGKGSQEEAILEVNLEAVEEVARLLRLRNIGGLIVLDLIDMKSRKHQQQVYRALKSALKRDRARTNVLPISDLGLLEMTRQRLDQSLLSSMYHDCPYCHGRGTVKSSLQISVDIQRRLLAVMRKNQFEKREPALQICIHPSVLERLRTEDEATIVNLQKDYAGQLTFKSDPLRQIESFTISEMPANKVVYAAGDQQPI